MSSGWEVYYVVFLAALLALGVPLLISLFSRLFPVSSASKVRIPTAPGSTGRIGPGRRINTRFFLGANAALVLISLLLVLIPCVVVQTRKAAFCILSTVLLIIFSVLYLSRKGDLAWLRSFREENPHADQ